MKRLVKKLFLKRNIIKGTRGAISLFLAMLMVPFTTIAGALLTAARVNSASAIFDEIMSNAADSTLADWDSFLKNRFGLLAVKQDTNADAGSADETINKVFKSYLDKNTAVLSNTFFNVESTSKGMYSLADADILRYQILEYSKLSVPTVLTFNGLDINGIIKSLENLIPGKNWLGFISSGMNLGSAIADVGTAMDALADATREKEEAKSKYDNSYTFFETSVKTLSEKIAKKERALAECDTKIAAQEKTVSKTQSEVDRLEKAVGATNGKIEELNKQIAALKNVLDLSDNALNLKKVKMVDSQELQECVDDAIQNEFLDRPSNYDDIQIEDLKETVNKKKKECENSLETLTSSSVYNNYKNANKQNSDATTELNKLKSDRSTKEQQYNEEISSLKQAANEKRNEYSNYIGELISKLKNELTKQSAANNAVSAASSSFSSLAASADSALSESDLKKLEKEKSAAKTAIEKNDEDYNNNQISYEEYSNTRNYYTYVGEMVDESMSSTQNMKTLYQTASTALTSAVNAGVGIFTDFNDQYYNAIIQQLETLNATVKNFSVENITSNFSQGRFKETYYKSLTLLTEKMVDDAQLAILNELVKDSFWETIKLMLNAITSLIKMLCIWDPSLNSNIDTNYYKEIKNGWENLETGNDEDRANSQKYKDLFGSFGASDLTSDGSYNLQDCICTVFSDVSFIQSKVTGINLIKSLLDFGNTWSQIEEKLSDIKTQFSNLLDWAKNLLEKFYEKTLVAGYLSYSTSCRTTYKTGRSLTGANFNLRGQSTSFEKDFEQAGGYEQATSISSFANIVSKAFTGDTAKCFVGAEQEYLINGKNSEIENQICAFFEIYALRLICDLFPIITNAEVKAMSACCGPFLWVVYVLEILIDPLIDTLLLTSGGSVALVKNQPFLVPSGIPSLLNAVTSLSFTNAQIAAKQENFAKSVNALGDAVYPASVEDYHINTDLDKDLQSKKVESAFSVEPKVNIPLGEEEVNGIKIDKSLNWKYKRELFKFDYQNYLFLYMMFCSSDKLISRFRDIVEYEAVQKLENNNYNVFVSGDSSNGGAGESVGTPFDLAKSYTYLRCEATFATNEFISLSGSNINMKKRLIYRGY